jgi:hypothetical protein
MITSQPNDETMASGLHASGYSGFSNIGHCRKPPTATDLPQCQSQKKPEKPFGGGRRAGAQSAVAS